MARLLTPFAFTANAVAFSLILYRSVTATIIHLQNGNLFFATLPMVTAVAAFVIMSVSAMPTARSIFIAKIDTTDRRNLVRSLTVSLLFVTGLGMAMVFKTESKLVFGVLPEVYLFVAFGVYALLMIGAFITPGYAFPELRQVSRPQEDGVDFQSQNKPVIEEERPIPPWMRALIVVAGFSLFAVTALFVYGINAHFLPLPEQIQKIGDLQLPIFAVFVPLYAFLGFCVGNKRNDGTLGPRAARIPIFVISLGAFGFVVPFAISNGLPALHSLFVSAPRVEQDVIVVKKGHGHRSKECSYTAEVAWPGAEGYLQTLCDVPRDLWETLVPGDRLRIAGPRTQYGQRYDTIVRM